MTEFIEACLAPVNLTLTVILGLCVIYWLFVILGALDLESLDFDFDVDTDVDVDVDADVDIDASIGDASVGVSMMRFLNIGYVPVTILLSVFVLTLWTISVGTYLIAGSLAVLTQLIALPLMIVGAVFVTKILTHPAKILYKKIKDQEEAEAMIHIVGSRCRVVSLTVDHRRGQVEVDTDGAPLLLNARTSDSKSTLKKGDEAVIVSEDDTRNVYYIRGF